MNAALARTSPTARKTIAIALLALVVVALVQWAVRPVTRAYEERAAAIETLTQQLAALRRIAESRPQAERQLEELRQRREVEGLTFDAPNPSRAAGALQEYVTQRIAAAGGQVRSIQVLPGDERGGIVRLTARVTTQASPLTLGPVLYALESSVPYLVVRKLVITSRGHSYTTSGPVRAPTLSLSMDVTGFLALAAGDGP